MYFEFASIQLVDLSLAVEETVLKNNLVSFPIELKFWNDVCIDSTPEAPAGLWPSIRNITVSRSGS